MELFKTKNWHKGQELDLKKSSLYSAVRPQAGLGKFAC